MRALRLFAIVAILHVPLAQAMTSDELAMTRNVAERGYLEAIRLLHAVEAFGLHYDKSLSKEALHRLAADGDADTQYRLGLHYESGSGGGTKDLNQAIEWFRRAAFQGNEPAQRALAHLGAAKPGPATPGKK